MNDGHDDSGNPGAGERDPLSGAPLSDEQQLYKENILDHYKHPRNKRVMDTPTCSLAGRNPLCGDAVTVSLKVSDGVVTDIAFQGTGCAISQAAMSLLTEYARGKSVDALRGMGQDDVVAMLGIPIGPVRLKCAMLGLRTAQDALDVHRTV